MEQIFMIEVFVKKIILKIEPPEKDEYELQMEAEAKKREAEELAALEAAAAAKKKGKKGGNKGGGKKKGKKGKEPPPPTEEEMKFLQSCTLQMSCLPLFDFYIAHDNFIPPPPPEPLPKKNPYPRYPFFGVGNAAIFLSRPSKLEEILEKTPIYITVWNRDQEMNCIGFVIVNWHETFFECLKLASELNPVDMDKGEYRSTKKSEMATNTIEMTRPLQCEEDLKTSEAERLPGRKYLSDNLKLKDVEVVRHWEGTLIDDVLPVAYFFGAPDITREPIRPPEEIVLTEDYTAPYTNEELAILAMGFPKGPCGGTNCPKRMEYRGSQHQFIAGEMMKGKYQHGQFVNKRDVHGPCGRLDCALAKKVRQYLANEGVYKVCKKPCSKDYY
ncbi:unnamed protein product [Arctia plantaginis]|uniref:Uncharacterized protein n=1 Tax=Arctia plantaginis TaxID=874455 RepID=A0A8S1A0V3_ARCPL|nr:unnamed protein product [Arctia plantaginis]